jgi:hypothetical protein
MKSEFCDVEITGAAAMVDNLRLSAPDEDDHEFSTSLDIRGHSKIRIGKKSWKKLLIGLGTVLTGSIALGQILRRLIELFF